MSARIEDAGDRLIVWNGNSAKRGAITLEYYEAIGEALERARDTRIRAVILTSEGDFFCAGGDLNVLIERRNLSEKERGEKIEGLHGLVRGMRDCPVPLIAAVKGGAAGAGLSLALACDLIVAEENAKFTAAYVKAGLVPDGGLTSSLARMVPRPLAMEMCLMGRPVMASRFADLSAINAVCPVGQAMEVATGWADALAAGPRTAQGMIRGLVGRAYEQSQNDQLDAERDGMARAGGGDEAAEGIAAFLEKRPASYR